MNSGRVLSGAFALLRQRGLLRGGMVVAALGLVYAAGLVWLQLYNPQYLSDLSDKLTTDLPPDFLAWVVAGAALLLIGGLLGEGRFILAAGRRPAANGSGRVAAGSALRRLPGLLALALLLWGVPALATILALALIANSLSGSADDALAPLTGLCCLTVSGGLVALALWPLHRLANCALLLDGQGPRTALRTARRLLRAQFGALFGLWMGVLLLNGLLVLVSGLLAGLAAAGVYAFWTLLNGTAEGLALAATGTLAALLGLGLLAWDGSVTAFNLNTWVLAYRDLQTATTLLPPLPGPTGTSQLLGRSRD
ncbi:MAG: hypothetical protein M3Z04_19070 [Chloroflexota bacterium]|nr:hypothetical protein [Chloroflexota bacterium]